MTQQQLVHYINFNSSSTAAQQWQTTALISNPETYQVQSSDHINNFGAPPIILGLQQIKHPGCIHGAHLHPVAQNYLPKSFKWNMYRVPTTSAKDYCCCVQYKTLFGFVLEEPTCFLLTCYSTERELFYMEKHLGVWTPPTFWAFQRPSEPNLKVAHLEIKKFQ